MPTAFLLFACAGQSPAQGGEDEADTVSLVVTRIRECARLYTSEYKIHKIITHDDQLRLAGTFLARKFDITLPMTERKIAIPMDATLKAYIDFSGFSEENVSLNGGRVEIVLPDPKVELTESRIDHEGIMRRVALVRSNFTDAELSDYERQGRATILSDVPRLGIIDVAMENAAHALVPMLRQMGYGEEGITITFRKTFTQSDLPLLLDARTLEYGK